MSRLIVVQDMPSGITSIDQIPDDFQPRRAIMKRADVIAAVEAEAPNAKVGSDGWMSIDVAGKYSVEVSLDPDREELDNFAFHVWGGLEADRFIARVLERLQMRAFDPESDSGIFQEPPS